MLIDRFESTPEPDEPLQLDDLELEQEDLYDEDQFYKESDMSPGPAPKLQGDIAKKPQQFDGPIYTVTSSVGPPQRARDDSSLEGEFLLNFIQSIFTESVLSQNWGKTSKANTHKKSTL